DHDLCDGVSAEDIAPGRHALGRAPFLYGGVSDVPHLVAVAHPEAPQVSARLGTHRVGSVAVRAVLVEQAPAGPRAPNRGSPRGGLGGTLEPDCRSRWEAVLVGEPGDVGAELG